jgi:hypothetical protein
MFFSQYFSFPCQYHSTNSPYPFIHLPATLHNVFQLAFLSKTNSYPFPAHVKHKKAFTHFVSQLPFIIYQASHFTSLFKHFLPSTNCVQSKLPDWYLSITVLLLFLILNK